MPRKPDEAFSSLRAANPVQEASVPGPDSPEATALFARITSEPRHDSADRRAMKGI